MTADMVRISSAIGFLLTVLSEDPRNMPPVS